MIFEFDQVRNFSALHIFTNNFYTKNVQVRYEDKPNTIKTQYETLVGFTEMP
jgi:hypothetical protein